MDGDPSSKDGGIMSSGKGCTLLPAPRDCGLPIAAVKDAGDATCWFADDDTRRGE